MNVHQAAKFILLVVVLAFVFSVVTSPAHAADAGSDKDVTKSGDKSISAKKGMEVLEGDPKKKDEEGATKTQKIIGFGSLFVMIIVVKFL